MVLMVMSGGHINAVRYFLYRFLLDAGGHVFVSKLCFLVTVVGGVGTVFSA